MTKFRFRLQQLLEYRRLQEKWAKDAYMEAVSRRIQAETEVEFVKSRRSLAQKSHPNGLQELVSLDTYLTKLDDDQRAQETALSVVLDEVESALQEWTTAKQNAAAIEKLRESEYSDWKRTLERKEQSDLDEWSSQRRAA